MIDDDIRLVHPVGIPDAAKGSIEAMVGSVGGDCSTIVGGRLEGAPDFSVIETALWRYRRAMNFAPYKPSTRRIAISGGLLAFSTNWARRVPFSRTYNEDWLWLLHCQALSARLTRSGARGVQGVTAKKLDDEATLTQEQMGEVYF